MSLRAFARWRGVRLSAVQRAIADGRLTKRSVGRDAKGRPFIKDSATAAVEWEERTRPRISAAKASENGAAKPSGLARETERERKWRADLFELDYKRKAKDLVPARDVEVLLSKIVVGTRTHLLGLPTRAKQRLPHLSSLDLVELDKLVREALEELATDNNQHQPKGESS